MVVVSIKNYGVNLNLAITVYNIITDDKISKGNDESSTISALKKLLFMKKNLQTQ